MSYLSTFGRLALALAPIHFLLCYTYIYFYGLGFGQNLHIFFGIQDIFSVGISRIFLYYLMAIISAPIIYVLYIQDSLKVRRIDSIDVRSWMRSPITRNIFFVLILAGLATFFIYLFYFRILLRDILIFLFAACSGLFFGLVSEKNGVSPIIGFAVGVAVLFYAMICLLAYSDGFEARTAPYKLLRSEFSTCNHGSVVLITIGDRFLIVDDLETRFLADGECKPIVQFPAVHVVVGLQ